jgi:hypothetical protein
MTRLLPNSPAKRAHPGRPIQPLVLSEEQHRLLCHARDTHPKAYVRERAAALLKVASGFSVTQVARAGLLRPRRRDTVAAWVQRFQAEGLPGLLLRPGRGRKPAFFPGASRFPHR